LKTEDAVLIVGGYGVVGQQVAQVIRQAHPDLPLIIAGRNPASAETYNRQLANADVLKMDLSQPNPLNGIAPRAIMAVANDPYDHLLLDAVKTRVPYLDITRWTERVRLAVSRFTSERLRAPLLFSSAWMAGAVALMAVAVSNRLHHVDSINISILYSLKDKAGPNSTEYMDRLAVPFEVMLNGSRQQVYPYTDPLKVTFPNGYAAKAYRFDTPDQFTLPVTTGARTVSTRIAFDDVLATNLLVFLTRSGIWKLISGRQFTPLRRSLLYNPGAGASHEIVIEAAGLDENGCPKMARAAIVDPLGQTHLTAVGALIQLERLLGLDGAPPPAPGIIYPDTAPQITSALDVFHKFGVTITMD
jgi:hypothetical protein